MYYHHYGLIDMIVHAIINGLIYGLIFKLFRQLSLGETILVVVLGIGVAALIWHARNRRRTERRP